MVLIDAPGKARASIREQGALINNGKTMNRRQPQPSALTACAKATASLAEALRAKAEGGSHPDV
jgi:hypothetical protein